jgi:tetratricopeptide (TPR) repeat protein
MTDHHFISYSSADSLDFAIKLCDTLIAGPPQIPAWLDKREIKPGRDWDEEIAEAIRTCKSLIFVMTKDSVMPQSVCKNEWTRALSYKKPVTPILLEKDAEMPFRFGSRQYIDFTSDFAAGLAKLRNHICWLDSPEGKLQSLKDRLADAKRDLHRSPADQRIKDDIAQLQKDIENQQRIFAYPEGAKKQVEQSIKAAQERERQPERPVSGIAQTKYINPPPGAAPDYFQDRTVETQLIVDFLKNDAQRMITVAGRGGMGKTAMVCRLLKSIENGKLPDNGGQISADGIVYLSESGSYKVNVPNIFADMCRLLPESKAKELDEIYKNPKISTEAKMMPLLEAFLHRCVILLLDNFENYIDPQTRKIKDTELDEAMRAILNMPQHAVKVIVTTRIAPKDLALVHPERQKPLDLDKGLESPYAENILREMDADGKVGLKNAPDRLLSQARERTQGNPRALEALFAILSADRDTTFPEILADTKKILPDNVVEVLVGEAFSRLDNTAQGVMEALSVYGRPVIPAAVDFMLFPFISGVNSAPVLGRLLNMHFVRKEEGRYYLHPVDREYAFSRIPSGKPQDRENDEPIFTQFSLLHRGADYFEQVRKPREEWKKKDDLAPQLAEFDLRCKGEDYETAAKVLLDIDFHYLMLWGQYKTVIDMHRRLQEKLGDPDMRGTSSGNLGSAYFSVGDYQEAIKCYEQALDIARENDNKQGEGAWLGGLGLAYSDLGQVEKAIEYYEKALAIDLEIGDRRGEGADLGNLGSAYKNLGQVEKAIEYYEKALVIAREIGYRDLEANQPANLGDALIYQNQPEKAAKEYDKSVSIAEETRNRQNQNEARCGQAFARLLCMDLKGASSSIEAARSYEYQPNDHNVLALSGVVALRMGETKAAKDAFISAITKADEMLARTGCTVKIPIIGIFQYINQS